MREFRKWKILLLAFCVGISLFYARSRREAYLAGRESAEMLKEVYRILADEMCEEDEWLEFASGVKQLERLNYWPSSLPDDDNELWESFPKFIKELLQLGTGATIVLFPKRMDGQSFQVNLFIEGYRISVSISLFGDTLKMHDRRIDKTMWKRHAKNELIRLRPYERISIALVYRQPITVFHKFKLEDHF